MRRWADQFTPGAFCLPETTQSQGDSNAAASPEEGSPELDGLLPPNNRSTLMRVEEQLSELSPSFLGFAAVPDDLKARQDRQPRVDVASLLLEAGRDVVKPIPKLALGFLIQRSLASEPSSTRSVPR